MMAIGSCAWAQNLLQNSDFGTVGALASGATDRYAVGEPWVSNVAFANMGIRVMASSAATEGGNVLVWRGSGNSNYISQEVTAEAGAVYEITISQVASGNANANFNVGIGTEAGKYDIASTTVRLGTNNNGTKSVKIMMPETVEDADGVLYFTFANTSTNSASSGSDPVSQIDYIKMEAIDALAYAKETAIANLPSAGDPIFGIAEDKIEAAKAAINAATSKAQINMIVSALTIPALSGTWNILNTTANCFLGTKEGGVVFSAEPVAVTFEKAANGFYIKAGDVYINMKGGNTWSMSADAEAKTAWTFTLADGKYTIKGPNGMIGADAAEAGSTLYGNKSAANHGYWKISEPITDERILKIQEIINYAEAAKIPTANVGENAFQYPSDKVALANNLMSTYSGHTAQEIALGLQAHDAKATDGKTYYDMTYLNNLLALMEQGVNEMNTLNAPEAGKKFNVVLTYDGWAHDNKAITYIANGRSDAGNYNIQYKAEANANYAQAFTLTQVEGNKYKMSQLDNDGVERYICTGVVYGGNTAQIRTTTNEDEALVVEVIADKEREGIYNIKNTEANQYIGSQDAGVFTVNSHIDFNLNEASKASATIAVSDAKYGTFIAPFATEIPSGVTAYTVSSINEKELVLATATSIEANVPYIVASESTVTEPVEGWGLATADNYTSGLLTGVYAETAAPAGSYVLQNQNDNVAFYIVSAEAPIAVPANKAYLTASSSASGAKAINFPSATAINAIEALTSGSSKIYDMNGREINKLQKGINIVNGVKVMVK